MAENVNIEFDDQTLQLVEVYATVELNEIVVHAEPVEVQVIEVFVDLNAAQQAIDAAAAAQAALEAMQGFSLDDLLANQDRLTTLGTITRTTDRTFAFTTFGMKMNGQDYANPALERTIEEATAGMRRGDLAVLTTANTIDIIPGTEDAEIYIFPNLPANTFEVGRFYVFGSDVDEPEVPNNGDAFMRKQTSIFVANHVDDLASYMFSDDKRHLVIGSDMEGIIQGLPANPDAILSPRMLHSIHNKSAFPVEIANNGTGHFRYFFPKGVNYILAPGEFILFLSDGVVDRRFVFLTTNMPDKVVYISKSSNFSFTNAYHGATVYITLSLNATIPSGLRSDFTCNVKTFSGAICTYLTSGTTISSQSDGTVQAEKSMVHISPNSTNTYILSGGGLT